MGVFRFRQFEVRNEKSAMKVNTDGVLLGALMKLLPEDRRLLDIGTGTGTIALMAAQRLAELSIPMAAQRLAGTAAHTSSEPPSENLPGIPSEIHPYVIDAIDIDGDSAEEAALNFAGSPWEESLHAYHCPLSQFRPTSEYDLIFSNPPFFTETLHSPSERKAQARHADSLPTEDIISFAAANLTANGRLSLILPSEQETEIRRTAAVHDLKLFRTVGVSSSDRKKPYRTIMEFSRSAGRNAEVLQERVTINMNGKYSEQYLDIVSDFLLLRKM